MYEEKQEEKTVNKLIEKYLKNEKNIKQYGMTKKEFFIKQLGTIPLFYFIIFSSLIYSITLTFWIFVTSGFNGNTFNIPISYYIYLCFMLIGIALFFLFFIIGILCIALNNEAYYIEKTKQKKEQKEKYDANRNN